MTNEQLLDLDGKIASGPGGEPVVITRLSIGDGMKKGSIRIQFSGMATDTLVNPRDAGAGSDPLPEPLPVAEGVDLEADDKDGFYGKLNDFFHLTPPLVDNDEAIMRFAPETEDSVYHQIVGKSGHFRLVVKPPTNPKFAPTVFTNLYRVPVQDDIVDKSVLEGYLRKIKERKEAAAKAEAAKEAELNAVFA